LTSKTAAIESNIAKKQIIIHVKTRPLQPVVFENHKKEGHSIKGKSN
jgi:hypothetical protein